jgi:hypothetical protein
MGEGYGNIVKTFIIKRVDIVTPYVGTKTSMCLLAACLPQSTRSEVSLPISFMHMKVGSLVVLADAAEVGAVDSVGLCIGSGLRCWFLTT